MKRDASSIVLGRPGTGTVRVRPMGSSPSGSVPGSPGEVVYETGTGRRWRAEGGTSWRREPEIYVPAVPGNWASPAPTTVGEAIDRLRAAFNGVNEQGPPPPDPTPLRAAGAWTPLILAPDASAESTSAATLLAQWLGRIASPPPGVTTYSPAGPAGVRVGTRAEWAAVDGAIPDWGPTWDYACVMVEAQYYLLGRTSRGVQLSLAAFLHAIGHRRLATGADWEILPVVGDDLAAPADVPAAAAQLDTMQGLGTVFVMPDGKPVSTDRQTSRLNEYNAQVGIIAKGLIQTGHAWGAARGKAPFSAAFAANPDWVAGPDPNVANPKFACYDPDLQQTMFEYGLSVIAGTNPSAVRIAVSMSASDGSSGWNLDCSGTHEQLVHNPADRQITLANAVQVKLRDADSDVHVAVLDYAELCVEPSPDVTIDSDVIVVWATSFMIGGRTAEQARDGWLSHGAVLHMLYSYPAIWTVGFGLPPGGRSFKRSELQVEVDRLNSTGAGTQKPIGWSGESTGAELVHARWHRSLAEVMFGRDAMAFWDGYPALAFPSAVSEATTFYDRLYGGKAFSGDLIHRLAEDALALLDALGSSVGNTAEIRRARALAIIVCHLALYRLYQKGPSGATMDDVLELIFRTRELDAVNYEAWYDEDNFIVDRQKAAALHPGHPSDLSKNTANWTDTPVGDAEIRSMLATALVQNTVLPFTPRGFSSDLVRVSGLVHSGARGSFAFQSFSHRWVLHSNGSEILTFNGANGAKGASTFLLREVASGEVVWGPITVPNDNSTHDTSVGAGFYPPISLIAQRQYYLEATIRDPVAWHWQIGTGMVAQPTEDHALFSGNSEWFFYVDSLATEVGFFAQSGTITFRAPDNSVIATIVANNDYYVVPVPDGLAGKPWRVKVGPRFALLTVPPQLAFDENELLLPAEVVAQDGLTVADATPSPVPTYTPDVFSSTLVKPATPLVATGRPRGLVTYYSNVGIIGYLQATTTSTTFHANGGVIPTGSGTSQVRFTDLSDNSTQTIAITNETGFNGAKADYTIATVVGHQYKIELVVRGKSIQFVWDAGTIVTSVGLGLATTTTPPVGSVNGCVYVRKLATVVGYYTDGGTAHWYDNTGKLITTLQGSHDYQKFTVPAGKDGTVMFFTGLSNRFEFQAGACPGWAMSPGELLIPANIAAADNL